MPKAQRKRCLARPRSCRAPRSRLWRWIEKNSIAFAWIVMVRSWSSASVSAGKPPSFACRLAAKRPPRRARPLLSSVARARRSRFCAEIYSSACQRVSMLRRFPTFALPATAPSAGSRNHGRAAIRLRLQLGVGIEHDDDITFCVSQAQLIARALPPFLRVVISRTRLRREISADRTDVPLSRRLTRHRLRRCSIFGACLDRICRIRMAITFTSLYAGNDDRNREVIRIAGWYAPLRTFADLPASAKPQRSTSRPNRARWQGRTSR